MEGIWIIWAMFGLLILVGQAVALWKTARANRLGFYVLAFILPVVGAVMSLFRFRKKR